ncbi:hypothetical protein [Halomonas sp. 3A7M]|uniref:hypothetical protein n=1 Tax=Halomonas sp. 3A7M TaxID=2742616 RepID=UPI001D02E14D|nr:hypothetical protein [Halomonas sp. 3A7M]
MWRNCTVLIITIMASVQANATAFPCTLCGGERELVREKIHCEQGYYRVNFRTQTMIYSLPLWQDEMPIECVEGELPNEKAVSAAMEAIKQHFPGE